MNHNTYRLDLPSSLRSRGMQARLPKQRLVLEPTTHIMLKIFDFDWNCYTIVMSLQLHRHTSTFGLGGGGGGDFLARKKFLQYPPPPKKRTKKKNCNKTGVSPQNCCFQNLVYSMASIYCRLIPPSKIRN